MNYEIVPGVGFESLRIGMSLRKLEENFGKPDEIEALEDEFFDDVNETIWHYNAYGIYPIVDMEQKKVVSILCDHPDLSLKNIKIMNMRQQDLISHLKKIGINKIEVDEEYVECENDGLNFVFEGGKIDLVDIDSKWNDDK